MLSLSFHSITEQYSTRTASIVMISITMPPKLGMAMGTTMLEPRAVEVSTRINARIVVAVVIRQGRTRRSPTANNAEQRQETDPDGDAQIDRVDLKQRPHVRVKQLEIQKPRLAAHPSRIKPPGTARFQAAELPRGRLVGRRG
jgi:hypothetical protein